LRPRLAMGAEQPNAGSQRRQSPNPLQSFPSSSVKTKKIQAYLAFSRNIPIVRCDKSRTAIRACGHGRHTSRPFSGACYDQCDDLRRGSRINRSY
jgi:hypothetical protein